MLSALLRVQQNSWMVGNLCRCKENVEGRSCNNCKPGTFGLDPGWKKEREIVEYGKFPLETIPSDEEQGCLKCYCSGVTDECSDARYVPSSSSSLLKKFSPLLDVFTITNPSECSVVLHGYNILYSSCIQSTVQDSRC